VQSIRNDHATWDWQLAEGGKVHIGGRFFNTKVLKLRNEVTISV
jgi:hypothetical protein